jgi:hypothetical protein
MSTRAASGGRQRPSQHPGVAGSSHAREQYRESPYNFPPSNSPSPSERSRTDSGSRSRSSSPVNVAAHLNSQLVPLAYLQNITVTRRDPVDEQLLRRFSTHSLSPTAVPR